MQPKEIRSASQDKDRTTADINKENYIMDASIIAWSIGIITVITILSMMLKWFLANIIRKVTRIVMDEVARNTPNPKYTIKNNE